MRFLWIASLLLSMAAGPQLADTENPWIPDFCVEDDAADPEATWNRAYERGFQAIRQGDHPEAERQMCRAARAARQLGPRDWRFAETLDELGLIAFSLGDLERAERMQGAAIAEMLLAVGPHGEPFRDEEPSEQAPLREDCRSGIRAYTTRLGWVHEDHPGRIAVDELRKAPWRIFAAGYLPLDRQLARRLDWLVSRYLLEENMTAATELGTLQRRILGESD